MRQVEGPHGGGAGMAPAFTQSVVLQKAQRRRTAGIDAPAGISDETREQMARLAHELNAPLSVVSGSLGTLEHYVTALIRQSSAADRSSPLDVDADTGDAEDVADKVLALLRLCREGTRRLEHVARQLRSFGGPPRLGLEAVDLSAVLQQAIRFARPGEASRDCITLDASPGLPCVRGVAESLGQAFVNLVRNALEAVADHVEPRVCIRIRLIENQPCSADAPRDPLAAPANQRWVEVSVRDNGPGLPAEIRRHLFQPFHSTKGAAGMGLGLTIAHEIVCQHGGSIPLGAGTGAEFRVRLPAGDDPPSASL
jgi:signal transduction histidine kinase